uniref:Syntaxin binding protein 3 n=1 Tax=Mus spicilegus TaxID=10103 RepID=A0A8C6HLU3_MUSSI
MAPPVSERGLKSVVWRKIKTAVFDDCRKEGEWKIMLLDEFTTKLLSSCCKMTDLLEEGITVIENIYKNREPVRQMKALYFISPTPKVSIPRLERVFLSCDRVRAFHVQDSLNSCNFPAFFFFPYVHTCVQVPTEALRRGYWIPCH